MTALKQGTHLCGLNQALYPPGTRTKTDILPCLLDLIMVIRMARHDQPNGIIFYMRGNGHLFDECLHFQDRILLDDRPEIRFIIFGGLVDDF